MSKLSAAASVNPAAFEIVTVADAPVTVTSTSYELVAVVSLLRSVSSMTCPSTISFSSLPLARPSTAMTICETRSPASTTSTEALLNSHLCCHSL